MTAQMEPANLPIVAKGVIDLDLMVRVSVLQNGPRNWQRVAATSAGAGLVLASLYAYSHADSHVAIYGGMLLGAILIVLGLLSPRGRLRRELVRKYREWQIKLPIDVVFEFHVDHLRVISKETDVKIAWSALSCWRDVGDFLLIFQRTGEFQTVPVGQFSPAQQAGVRTLLSQRLPRR
jgi:hypothetical protein